MHYQLQRCVQIWNIFLVQDIDVNLATEWLAKSDGEVDGGWGVLITKNPPPILWLWYIE